MMRLTLYTRPGCHLCEAMKGVVDEIAREESEPITLREVDISGDVDLERRFGTEIPVLACGEQVLARVRTTRAALLRSLRAWMRPAGRPTRGQ